MHGSIDATANNWLKEAQKGYIRVGLLILLSKQPAHGYELMKQICERSHGFFKPTPGGVYPILRNLEKTKYIKGHWETQNNRKLKVYTITDSGKEITKNALIKQAEIASNVNNLFKEFAVEVLKVKSDVFIWPVMPGPFSLLLNEEECDVEKLIAKRNYIKKHMKDLQENLDRIDKRIAELKANPPKDKTPS